MTATATRSSPASPRSPTAPAATGAHTTDEQVPVAELLRVARVYALTALAYCGAG